jgi:hypothetical protein
LAIQHTASPYPFTFDESQRSYSREQGALRKFFLYGKVIIMVELLRKKLSLVVLMAALFVAFTGIFVIEALDHDCTGEHCAVCLQIEIAHRLIEAFGRLGVIALAASFAAAVHAGTIKPQTLFRSFLTTPVSLKIKFSC